MMSDYADNYMTDNENVHWVKMDYVNPIMKKDDLAMDKLEADNRELTAKVKELEKGHEADARQINYLVQREVELLKMLEMMLLLI
jgi:hypothetical protein